MTIRNIGDHTVVGYFSASDAFNSRLESLRCALRPPFVSRCDKTHVVLPKDRLKLVITVDPDL